MLFALIYYAVDAHKWFQGPRVNVEHLIYGVSVEGPESGSDNAKLAADTSA